MCALVHRTAVSFCCVCGFANTAVVNIATFVSHWHNFSNCKQDNWVLTPHPGEAAELLNTSSKNIQDNRQLSLKKISNKFGGVIILKGHNTMIGHDENPSNICLKGNPGMATAGSGDVLAGIVSAMIGQKLSLFDAN